ncbi:MAG: sigma-70 family RNA polymerase sigma factor [Gemmatimonadota bacterium]
MGEKGRITNLLSEISAGNRDAYDRLTPIVYEELRRIAQRQFSREAVGHTLQTTALVHEAFVKLVDLDRIEWNDRVHFFALSARLMRQILIDHAIRKRALKRGGNARHLSGWQVLDAVPAADPSGTSDGDWSEEMLALDEALTRLAALDERQASVVEYRFFAGLTIDETAAALDVSPPTVKRDWSLARAWLNRELSP